MAIDQRRAIVRAESLIAAEPFQSADGTRYYLHGTCVIPQEQGVIISATDGHTLFAQQEIAGFASGLATVWRTEARRRLGSLLTAERKRPATIATSATCGSTCGLATRAVRR
jgi:hypothetical protein